MINYTLAREFPEVPAFTSSTPEWRYLLREMKMDEEVARASSAHCVYRPQTNAHTHTHTHTQHVYKFYDVMDFVDQRQVIPQVSDLMGARCH